MDEKNDAVMLGQLRGDVDSLLRDRHDLDRRIQQVENDSKGRDSSLTLVLEAYKREVDARSVRLEQALFGNPNDPKATAVLPTMTRINTWLDVLCWLWRKAASITAWGAGLGSSAFAAYSTAKSMGWI